MAYQYQETVSFHPIIQSLYVAMLVFFAWTAIQSPNSTEVLVLFPVGVLLLAIPLLFGRLVIVVDHEALRATWGFLGWPRKTIPLSNIYKTTVITYKPLRQFGGWGIRCGRIDGQMTAAYTYRGTRGVLLSLTEEIKANFIHTRRFLVGSQEPERLQQALGR